MIRHPWFIALAVATLGIAACGTEGSSDTPDTTGSEDIQISQDVTPDAVPGDVPGAPDMIGDTLPLADTNRMDIGASDVAPDAGISCPDAQAPTPSAFDPGPYGVHFRETAGAFTVPTLDGEWDFAASWTGRDSYIFVQYSNDERQSADLLAFLQTLWFPQRCTISGQLCASDSYCGFPCPGCCQADAEGALADMLRRSPPDTHYVFSSFDEDAEDDMRAYRAVAQQALARLDDEERCHWSGRLHFVSIPVWSTEGWLGDVFAETGWLWFAVDSFQKMRQVGMPADPMRSIPSIEYMANEARYFAFERDRQERLEAEEDVTEVRVFDGEEVYRTHFDLTLPEADQMAAFDTLELDVGMYCQDHLDSNCGEWDYLSHLYVCARRDEPTNPHADTPCQPHVPGEPAVEEVLGTCAGSEDTCTSDDECTGEAACEGYVAPQQAVDPIPADRLPCTCTDALEASRDADYVCNTEGTGYEPCACPCDIELGRWITTYGREGRWVTDVSPLLPLLRRGGTLPLYFQSGNPYLSEMTMRFSRRGDGPVPTEVIPLFTGGAFNETYNEGRETLQLNVPDDVVRAEIVAYITGHGFGVEAANCAEFCNHTHHFTVNDTEFVKEHPEAGTYTGCMQQIEDGVVPNQYGTWPLGRGGWCPGLDVKPWVADVTDALRSGENDFDYRALYEGADYVPVPTGGSQGFPANIRMTSYLVLWR